MHQSSVDVSRGCVALSVAAELQGLSDTDSPSSMLLSLKVTDIDCYDRNPRQFGNVRTEDIRTSLEAVGFHGSFTVTKKLGGERYFLAAGGNTTLRLLQQLYDRTGDERFLWVQCRYQAYESEISVLCQHLGENLNRGQMLFFEVAKGMVDLLTMLEEERRASGIQPVALSLREASDELARRGLKADKSTIALWRFTVTVLGRLGPAVVALTLRGVQSALQPRINALALLAEKFPLGSRAFFEDVVGSVLEGFGRTFQSHEPSPGGVIMDHHALCDQIEAAFASSVCESVQTIRHMLATLRLSPKLDLKELRQPSPNIVAQPIHAGASRRTAPVESAADATAPEPVPTKSQAPLPLGPGLVRRSPPATHAPQRGTSHNRAAAVADGPMTLSQERTSSLGPLFDAPGRSHTDPLSSIHIALEQLCLAVGLEQTLRWYDRMPLGFYLEPPDPGARPHAHAMAPDDAAQMRVLRSHVWWALTTMAGQWLPGSKDHIDQESLFYQSFSTNQTSSPFHGTGIESGPPTTEEACFARISPGRGRLIMRQLMKLECLIAEQLEQLPERWTLLQKLIELEQT